MKIIDYSERTKKLMIKKVKESCSFPQRITFRSECIGCLRCSRILLSVERHKKSFGVPEFCNTMGCTAHCIYILTLSCLKRILYDILLHLFLHIFLLKKDNYVNNSF